MIHDDYVSDEVDPNWNTMGCDSADVHGSTERTDGRTDRRFVEWMDGGREL